MRFVLGGWGQGISSRVVFSMDLVKMEIYYILFFSETTRFQTPKVHYEINTIQYNIPPFLLRFLLRLLLRVSSTIASTSFFYDCCYEFFYDCCYEFFYEFCYEFGYEFHYEFCLRVLAMSCCYEGYYACFYEGHYE